MIRNGFIFNSLLLCVVSTLLFCNQPRYNGGKLNLPKRSENAKEGSEFVQYIIGMSIIEREEAVIKEILEGNVPAFSRTLKPLKFSQKVDEETVEVILFATADYVAIGSEADYFYIPMTPSTAQYLAGHLECSLPTSKIVDLIYSDAVVKLIPQPIPPSEAMVTVPVFKQHTDSINNQIEQLRIERSADNIISGHKKDIVISNKIYLNNEVSERVVIYGWHLDENNPIQPLYNGHTAAYVDYSHGIRLISKQISINGKSHLINEILKDPYLYKLLSDEGMIERPYYPESDPFIKGE